MRQNGPSTRRPRSRHHNNGGNNNNNNGNRGRSASSLRHQNFDSNGPEVRVRGNARQVCDKYQALARDASSAGNEPLAENYLQHAEHYYRITQAIEEASNIEQRKRTEAASPKQPDVPSNYYVPEGKAQPAPATAKAPAQVQAPAPATAKAPAKATVDAKPAAPVDEAKASAPKPRGRRPQAKPAPKPEAPVESKAKEDSSSSPFFSLDESEDNTGSQPQKLVAG